MSVFQRRPAFPNNSRLMRLWSTRNSVLGASVHTKATCVPTWQELPGGQAFVSRSAVSANNSLIVPEV